MSDTSFAQPTHDDVRLADPTVSFDQTVPRNWVHRRSISEVFLTDCVRLGEHAFHIGAQWPRRHALYAPDSRNQHDVTLALEAVRQSGILLAGRHFALPATYSLALKDISVAVEDRDGFDCGRAPANVVLEITTSDERLLHHTLAAMRLNVTFFRDHSTIARASGAFACLSPGVYSRVRGNRHPLLPSPRQLDPVNFVPAKVNDVGRALPLDVLIGDAVRGPDQVFTFAVKVDTDHPTLFDHPLDHLPGMFQVEVVRQAAHYVGLATRLYRQPTMLDWRVEFLGYGELEQPTWCVVRTDPMQDNELAVHACIEQPHGVIARSDLRLGR